MPSKKPVGNALFQIRDFDKESEWVIFDKVVVAPIGSNRRQILAKFAAPGRSGKRVTIKLITDDQNTVATFLALKQIAGESTNFDELLDVLLDQQAWKIIK